MRVSRGDDTGEKSVRGVEIVKRTHPVALAALGADEVGSLRLWSNGSAHVHFPSRGVSRTKRTLLW